MHRFFCKIAFVNSRAAVYQNQPPYLVKSKTRTKTILDSNEYMYRSLWRELKNIYDQLVKIESNMYVTV